MFSFFTAKKEDVSSQGGSVSNSKTKCSLPSGNSLYWMLTPNVSNLSMSWFCFLISYFR